MDESESLNALSEVLTAVAEKPYDITVHAQHVRLTKSLQGMESEAQSAMEMMVQFVSAPEEIWLSLIDAKEKAVDLDTKEGIEELLALYLQAENDYLCKCHYLKASLSRSSSFSYSHFIKASEFSN